MHRQELLSEQQALEALNPWADALFTGDPAVVDAVLAPEFQILRSDGSGYDKQGYLGTLPSQQVRSRFSSIVATGSAELMMLQYSIETDSVIEGKSVVRVSPRLSVFQRESGKWLSCAHANFAPLN